MVKHLTSLLCLCGYLSAESVNPPQLTENNTEREERMKWFRDSKFGLFIHWGPASISGEEISWGMKDRIEGGERHKKVPREEYMNLYKGFNPTEFNADDLLSLAKGAGMKYIVFVSKHHDGFSLWDTAEKHFPAGADYPEKYSISDTPYKKDICKEIQEATLKHGLKLGWYYSTRDWTHPEYMKGDNKIYNSYYENQVEELLKNYGPVDLMWFDHAFGDWDIYTIPTLYEKMYDINPDLIVNNRAARGLKNIPSKYEPLAHADYDTPENRMGAFQHGRPWESCMILSPHPDHGGWSYRPEGITRSLKETLELLSSCVTGDGNMLLNLAPLPDGTIKPEERAILEGIAPWIKKYGEAVYNTRGGPWINGEWGGATYRENEVYLHLFNSNEKIIELNRLPQSVISVETIDGTPIPFTEDEKALKITIPDNARDQNVSIIKLTLDAPVKSILYGPALISQTENQIPGTIDLPLKEAKVKGKMKISEDGVIKKWVDGNDQASWNLDLKSPGKYKVQITTSCEKPGSVLCVRFSPNTIKNVYSAVPVTGDFKNYQTHYLGEVYFPNVESLKVTLGAVHRQSWKPAQIKSLKFIPVN